MDGFQVMEGLKEIDTDGYLPVLAVTAHPGHSRTLKQNPTDRGDSCALVLTPYFAAAICSMTRAWEPPRS
jgi:CheY-like chemotaxis protein